MRKDNKNYVLKVKYSIVETTGKGDRKLFDRKINKSIISENKLIVLDKIKSFEDELNNKNHPATNPVVKAKDKIWSFARNCQAVYYRMLRA
ncbi:hypothetical protein [Abyssalbus ytuae]|uniref:Uncharacterized protein n=1 Tax=Abyssalbus ytuae TaxID=2926907 RepID=A0A9E6ZWQ9_9FLAO|nr:hypothetical protein [Abyssalbus ytuae]UOB19168.1 hypothetical protein MQE35_07680 [Abyssalbus ytuae]